MASNRQGVYRDHKWGSGWGRHVATLEDREREDEIREQQRAQEAARVQTPQERRVAPSPPTAPAAVVPSAATAQGTPETTRQEALAKIKEIADRFDAIFTCQAEGGQRKVRLRHEALYKQARQALKTLKEQVEAGDWMTAVATAEELGVSYGFRMYEVDASDLRTRIARLKGDSAASPTIRVVEERMGVAFRYVRLQESSAYLGVRRELLEAHWALRDYENHLKDSLENALSQRYDPVGNHRY